MSYDAYPTPAPPPDDEAGPQIDLGKVLWRRKWVILLLTLLGVGGGYLAFRNSPPVYQSGAALYVRSTAPSVLGESGLGDAGAKNYLATQAAIIRSGLVLGRAAQRPGIAELPSFEGDESAVASLAEAVTVNVDPETNFLTISAEAARPEDSQDIVEAVIAAYGAFNDASYDKDAGDLLQQLRVEKANAERQRDELWAQRSELTRQVGGVDLAGGGRTSIQAQELAQLSQELLVAQQEARDLKLTLDQAEAAKDSPVQLDELLPRLEEGASPASATRGELAAMRRELRAIEYTSGPNAQRVMTLRQQVDDLTAELEMLEAGELDDRLNILRRRHTIAESRQQQLQQEYADRREQVLNVNARAADEEKVRRDLEIVEDWLRRISQRVSEINVAESSGPPRPEVVQAAGPGRQVEPKAAQLIGMGLVLGLMGGFGLAFVLEWLDPKVRSIEDFEAILNLQPLGAVPKFGDRQTPAERARQMADHPRSDAAESYRGLRTMLMAVFQQRVVDREIAGDLDVREAQTILVTSPMSGDGKTTVAANLATAFARLDRRTLLIDADCRRPRLHEYLLADEDAASLVGLSGVLQDDADLDAAVRPTAVRNLSLLPCGPHPADPVEMLNSETFVALLDRLSRDYDRIVLDSPPVLPVTDARVLGAIADATVLVVRASRTTRRAARIARDGLIRTGADVVGFVANDVPVGKRRFDGYDAYTYAGGYGHAEPTPARLTSSSRG